ncbi:hypothetical protein L0152_33190, partial [bacterium]|nr:hypothetical protein [bacterium]
MDQSDVRMRFGRKSKLDSILVRLHSNRLEDREQAADELKKYSEDGLTLDEGRTLLIEATKEFPPRQYSSEDTSTDLVAAACNSPRTEYIPIVLTNFPKYSKPARYWALSLLSRIPENKGILSLLDLVRTHAREGLITDLPVELTQDTQKTKILFPEILQFTNTAIGIKIYHICLACCEAGLLSTTMLEPHTTELLEIYRTLNTKITRRQRKEGLSWMWEEDYLDWRFDAALLLDLIGYFPGEKICSELFNALRNSDPRLKFFAAISLVRKGKDVADSDLQEIAASAETRNWLFERLNQLERPELFPEAFNTQEAFAESEMVNWLIFPTELGRVPDEIELMKVISIETPHDGPLDYYVFRFRTYEPHWAAKDGWTAGISGPFLRKNAPRPKS